VAARSPLIKHYGGDRPQEFRAYLRAVTNVGISLGAVGAGWAVQVGSVPAYRIMVVGNALAFVVAAGLLVLLPPVEPAPATGGPRWIALRDRPYLLLTVLDGMMAVQFKVLTVAVPLWLVGATRAPHWLVSGTMLTGTVLVVVFQVRASRRVDSPRAGGEAYRRAGVAFLGSCVLISLSAGVPAWAASALLLTAVVIHTVGELWHAPPPGSRSPSPWPRPGPPASTSGSSVWGPVWRRPSARRCSSGCASAGAAPAGTSWASCSP
jgi:hypothetical protein